MELGSVPPNEECEQVGTTKYNRDRALKECRTHQKQLGRQFTAIPSGAYLFVRTSRHDFGEYFEVAVSYDDKDHDGLEFAYKAEETQWQHWDKQSCIDLDLLRCSRS